MNIFADKRFLIYGKGISGKAAVRAVRACGGKAKLRADADGTFVLKDGKLYDACVVSPGIKPSHAVYGYCKANNIPVIGEVDIGFAIAKERGLTVIGVTGTNGKTTTTQLIADLVGGAACGNIGYPISTAALKTDKSVLVCELSSFQLYNASVHPHIAIITNVASDHVDWHGSIEEYFNCKLRIAENLTADDFLILGDVPVKALDRLNTDARIINCSACDAPDGACVRDGFFCFSGERVCPTDYLRLQGEHNIKNALCAIAAAKCMGVDNRKILSALSSATPAPHRVEFVGKALGKYWIDDSKGTNVAACKAAIEQTHGSLCLIVGGRSKATDFSELFDGLDKRVAEVIAMGEAAQDVRDSAVKLMPELKITLVNGLSDAVRAAARSNAETVLLSPACASFDEFKNYAKRGEKFKAEVKALAFKPTGKGARE